MATVSDSHFGDALGYAAGQRSLQQQASLSNNPLYAYNGTDSTTTLTGWNDFATSSGTVNIGGEDLDGDMIRKMKESMSRGVMRSAKKMLRFFRVNELVEEGEDKLDDPIDELRLKVARWLNPKEEYNFA